MVDKVGFDHVEENLGGHFEVDLVGLAMCREVLKLDTGMEEQKTKDCKCHMGR